MKAIHALLPLGLLVGAGSALAQPSLPPADSPDTLPGEPDDQPPPAVVDTRPADPPPEQPQTTMMQPAPSAPAEQRPTEFAVGLGLGYVIPSDLSTPNTTSARLRLPSGLTFEPRVTLGHESETQDDGIDSETTSANAVELAIGVRYPMRSHGKVDLSLLGAAGVALTTINPDGDDNNTSINSFEVSWGIALDYWVTQHWNVSFSASNPILRTTATNQEQGPGVETSDSHTAFGAVFDPTLAVMLHMYL